MNDSVTERITMHYDLLIDEGNDPFRDPPVLQEYMDRWDGQALIDAMALRKEKTVLEIGIGTGRIAKKVAPHCLQLTGIDISPKTIERASINLSAYSNIVYLCADFLRYPFTLTYDVIYSSLTMMHFEDKQGVIAKVDSLLKVGGVFCLSIDKNQSKYIDMGDRRIEVYPDTVDDIVSSLSKTNMKLSAVREIENAFLITCNK